MVQMMRSPTSVSCFISCSCVLLITSFVDGQAVISVVEPLNIVAHRPGQFTLSVQKTGLPANPATIIVEVYSVKSITHFMVFLKKVAAIKIKNVTHISKYLEQ